ncbi:hypothetical protein Back2_25850 [Nocardioides baekrokdamisoli]|uniref:Uncharacterized protein n=1 Tax=Nocardioides baekrokdamisoli TaxID=1804624 RepID=A0A3G9J3T5_9ACTN|nr:hypothetical protein [Nocardioides baekrokdamisoli]BBH18298.1 hypothetical protein Back2_25850 [Nocardioides baekrokdamisoli]
MQHRAESDETPIGSAADEAAKLLNALGEWAKDQSTESANAFSESVAGLAGRAAHAVADLPKFMDQHLAAGAPECAYCPVCRTVHVVREASPDVRVHLASAALSLMQAATTVLNAMATPVPGGAQQEPTVEKIDLDDDSEWD